MTVTLDTITVGRRTYLVEPVNDIEVFSIPVRFILHDPRGRKYPLVPHPHRPDQLVACATTVPFSRFRPTPLAGVRFAVEDGRLVVAAPDA